MARLRASTQGTAMPGHGEPQGMLLTAVRTAAVANDEPWHGTFADRARQGHSGRDAEATVQRQSSNAQMAKGVNGAVPSAAAGDADTGPHPTTATAGQGKVQAEHIRRSGRHASVGVASSSEGERAGGQQRAVVRTRWSFA